MLPMAVFASVALSTGVSRQAVCFLKVSQSLSLSSLLGRTLV